MKKIIYLAIAALISLSSCAPAYFKDAKYFVNTKGDKLAVMFVSPSDNIIYTNHKSPEIAGFDTLSDDAKNEALKKNSLFLSKLNNSTVYELFVNKFLKSFAGLGLDVYTKEFENEFNKNQNKLTIDLSQIEFDEYFDMVKDEKTYFGKHYYNDTYINAFAINVWIDYIKQDNRKLLFASNRITDYHKGWFETGYYENDIYYYEDNIAMDFEHLEYFLDVVARRYAEYMYDYILTDYVSEKQAALQKPLPNATLHFNSKKNKIYTVEDNYKFVEIK